MIKIGNPRDNNSKSVVPRRNLSALSADTPLPEIAARILESLIYTIEEEKD